MAISPAASAIEQIEKVKSDCKDLLKRIKTFSPKDTSECFPDTFRLIATPMLYSVWERSFTLCHAIALRFIRDTTPNANKLDSRLRAVWLIKTPFYRSLVDRLRVDSVSTKVKKGEFSILCEFLPELEEWLYNGLDPTISTDDLVMTGSNVNPDIVGMNARAIGIDKFTKFKKLKLGRLHDLVGQRNDIGHGAIIDPPSNDTFLDLFNFTENLVSDYCSVFKSWLQSKRGIIDKQKNPFSCGSWINQGLGLTNHRQNQVENILGADLEDIRRIGRNNGNYPAFIAIRWGFAEIRDGKLVATRKWTDKIHYDGFGERL